MTTNVKIEPSWHRVLAGEWDKDYFASLAQWVRGRYATHVCYPPAPLIFNAFEQCPFDRVRVVILGQDPYHGPGQAMGLSFSVADDVAAPPSLRNILNEVWSQTGAPRGSNDLTRWARQGVLLLNTTLTVDAGAPLSHRGRGWEQFTDTVISRISEHRPGVVFMLWGSHAISKRPLIDTSRHCVLTSAHPSPLSAHRGFMGNGHFTAANEWLARRGEEPVSW